MNPDFLNLPKRKKHDILSDLLAGKSTEGIISQKELNALNRLLKRPPANNTPDELCDQLPKTNKSTAADKKTKKTKNVTAPDKTSQKAKKKTYYLSDDIAENLENTEMTIRSLVPKKLRYKISKSLIVNKALAMILHEFKAEGKKSRLMRTIIQNT